MDLFEFKSSLDSAVGVEKSASMHLKMTAFGERPCHDVRDR